MSAPTKTEARRHAAECRRLLRLALASLDAGDLEEARQLADDASGHAGEVARVFEEMQDAQAGTS